MQKNKYEDAGLAVIYRSSGDGKEYKRVFSMKATALADTGRRQLFPHPARLVLRTCGTQLATAPSSTQVPLPKGNSSSERRDDRA